CRVITQTPAVQTPLPRMRDKYLAAAPRDRVDEAHEEFVSVRRSVRHRFDTDATLDGHRNLDRPADRADALRNEQLLAHQTRAEPAALHAVARAAAIEIYLVV